MSDLGPPTDGAAARSHPEPGSVDRPNTVWTPAGRVDRFGVTLLLIIVTLIVDFSTPSTGWAGVLSIAFGAATFLFVLTMSDARPSIIAGLRLAAVLVVALSVVAVAIGDGSRVPSIVDAIGAALAIVAPVVIARRLLREPVISIHTVLGGLCLYLLIGLFFAYVFAFVNAATGAFFVQAGATRTADDVYFSYVTMATIGYGDLTPQTDLARMLAVADGITGQLFLVTVVAFFLSHLGSSRSRLSRGQSGHDPA